MVSKILIIALIVGTASAGMWGGMPPSKPKPAEVAMKEGCYIGQIKDFIPYGDSYDPPGECFRISCGRKWTTTIGCHIPSTDDPKCHLTKIDLSKPYPECCPEIKCDVDNN